MAAREGAQRASHPRRQMLWLLCAAILIAHPAQSRKETARRGLGAAELGIIINEADVLSRAIGDYYVERRGIPAANVARVRFEPTNDVLARVEFERIRKEV